MERREPSYTVGGNVSWYSHYGEQYGGTLENHTQNYHMTQKILLLGIYPDKTFLKKDTCTCMFTEALFTIAKTWKQPKCPLTDEWIIRNGIQLIHKKGQNNAICSNMDGTRDSHAK